MAASKAVMEGRTPYKAKACIKVMEQGFGDGAFYRSIPQYALPFYLQNEMDEINKYLIADPLPKI